MCIPLITHRYIQVSSTCLSSHKYTVHRYKSNFMRTIDNSQVHASLKYIHVKPQIHRHKSSFMNTIHNSQVHAKVPSTCKINHKYIGTNQAHKYKQVNTKAICKTKNHEKSLKKPFKKTCKKITFQCKLIYIEM